jgi:long-chain acyl-CoA synthetase
MVLETLQHLAQTLAAHGDRSAIVALVKEDTKVWSFAALVDHARRLASGLTAAGLPRGAHVVLFAPNRPEWVVACLALFETGAVPVLIDSQMGKDDLQHVLTDSAPDWMFTTKNQAEGLRHLDHAPELRLVFLDAAWDDPQSWLRYLAEGPLKLSSARPEDTAALFYTSGTSGRPKGVPLSHRNLTSNLQALLGLHLIQEDDRLLVPLPLHHVYPFMVGMLAPLAAGIPVILPFSLTGPQVLRALDEGQATAIIGVPRLYEALYAAIEKRLEGRGRIASALFHLALGASVLLRRHLGIRIGPWLFAPLHRRFAPHLRVVFSGGAALDPGLAWKLEGLGWQVGSGYGLTETSPVLTLNAPGRGRIGTAGRPLPGVEIRIAEPKEQTEHGEVLAKGPNVFSGYRDLPEKTREAFTSEGYFHTGDLGYFEDDYLCLVGRSAEMIVLAGGENIRPDYVEEVLNQGRSIKETGVLEKDDRLVALIVPEAGATRESHGPDLEELIRAEVEGQSRQLPSHHRLSDYVISLDPLPRTHLGKLRRYQLKARFEQAKRQGREPLREIGPLPIERMSPEDQHLLENPNARQLWHWLAHRFPDVRLTPETNLQLDLGIDSLAWLGLTLELREATGTNLDQEAIGRIETVRDLLQEAAEASPAGRGRERDPLALLREPERLLDEAQRRWLAPPDRVIRGLGAMLFSLNRWLMHWIFNLKVQGLEHLPEYGPFVLTPNHLSYLDGPALAAALSDAQLARTYWAGFVGVMFRNVMMRLLSRAMRVLPVDARHGPLSNLALGLMVLKGGNNLVWFPEGTRSASGQLQPFEAGIGLLLKAQRVPAVPVWISGTYEALPPQQWWPRRRPIAVRFGRVADPAALEQEGKGEDLQQRIANALHDRVAELRET